MITILIHEWVTGGGLAGSPLPGSWAAEGSAMRRTLAREFAHLPEVRVVATLDARLPEDQGPWTVVRVGEGEELRAFEALASQADYTLVVAPETGGVLAARARALERSRSLSLGSTAEAIELTADKLRLGAFLAARGIATPQCRRVRPGAGLPRDCSYPAVLKPIDGAGSVDTYLVTSPEHVPDEAMALSDALLQPLSRGVPMSASFLASPDGPPQLIGVGWQRMAFDDRRFTYQGGTIPAPRDLLGDDVTRAVASVAGLKGFVGVDFVYDEARKRASVIEINPRTTTSIVGLTQLLRPGILARSWLDLAAGKPSQVAESLAELVHSQPSVTFLADGTFREEQGRPMA